MALFTKVSLPPRRAACTDVILPWGALYVVGR